MHNVAKFKRINVSAAFYHSIEFQETGFFFYRFNLLNPSATGDPPFLATMRAVQEIGEGVVVRQPGWDRPSIHFSLGDCLRTSGTRRAARPMHNRQPSGSALSRPTHESKVLQKKN
jgi:hypothetical protein